MILTLNIHPSHDPQSVRWIGHSTGDKPARLSWQATADHRSSRSRSRSRSRSPIPTSKETAAVAAAAASISAAATPIADKASSHSRTRSRSQNRGGSRSSEQESGGPSSTPKLRSPTQTTTATVGQRGSQRKSSGGARANHIVSVIYKPDTSGVVLRIGERLVSFEIYEGFGAEVVVVERADVSYDPKLLVEARGNDRVRVVRSLSLLTTRPLDSYSPTMKFSVQKALLDILSDELVLPLPILNEGQVSRELFESASHFACYLEHSCFKGRLVIPIFAPFAKAWMSKTFTSVLGDLSRLVTSIEPISPVQLLRVPNADFVFDNQIHAWRRETYSETSGVVATGSAVLFVFNTALNSFESMSKADFTPESEVQLNAMYKFMDSYRGALTMPLLQYLLLYLWLKQKSPIKFLDQIRNRPNFPPEIAWHVHLKIRPSGANITISDMMDAGVTRVKFVHRVSSGELDVFKYDSLAKKTKVILDLDRDRDNLVKYALQA